MVLGSGVVTRLHDEVYARLPHGRLVLLGGPGSGKTSAMILLLLAALRRRESASVAERRSVPVPIWLTLGGWDPTTTSLADWALDVVVRDHPYLRASAYGPDAAVRLLQGRRVALFLDGLDEMPPGVWGQAMERLDRESADLKIVVTSRPDEYRSALERGRLHNAAVIELRPVRPRAAIPFLTRDQVGERRTQWAKVGDHLTSHPEGVTARALSSPLALSLARTAYQHADPIELTDSLRFATVSSLREHLVQGALVAAYPEDSERANAVEWLSRIAHHMGSERDLRWWRVADLVPTWRLMITTAMAAMLAGLVTAVVGIVVVGELFPPGHAVYNTATGQFELQGGDRLPGQLWFAEHGARIGLICGFVLWLGSWWLGHRRHGSAEVFTFSPRWPRRSEFLPLLRVAFVTALVLGVAVGVTTQLVSLVLAALGEAAVDGFAAVVVDQAELEQALASVVALGLGVGVPAGIALGLNELWSVPVEGATAATPRSTYLDDRRARRWTTLFAGLLVGLTVGVAIGTRSGSSAAVFYGVTTGIGIWLIANCVFGRGSRLRVAEIVLSRSVRRLRFLPLLEDARQRQVLRQAGAVYQFRHAELQEHLARRYQTKHGLAPLSSNPTVAHRRGVPPHTRLGRWGSAVGVAAVVTAVIVETTPLVIAMVNPDHDTLVDTPAGTLTWSPDGHLLATSTRDSAKTLEDDSATRVWNADDLSRVGDVTGEAVGGVAGIFDQDLEGAETGSAFGPQGQTLATLHDGTVRSWDLSSGKPRWTLEVAGSTPTFSPDQELLATVDISRGTVNVWDLSGESEPLAIPAWKPAAADGDQRSLAFSPAADARTMATAGDGPVRLWDLSTGELMAELPADQGSTTIAFSPDGTKLALTKDDSLVIWDVKSSPPVLQLEDSAGYEGAVFSPDGTKLVAANAGVGRQGLQIEAAAVTVWDLNDGGRLDSLTAGTDRVHPPSLRFSPDGSTVASAWADETWSEDRLRIWNLDDDEDPKVVTAGGATLLSLAFNPDGDTLATGWSDDRVRLYAVP
jgi:WD40 repeat protein